MSLLLELILSRVELRRVAVGPSITPEPTGTPASNIQVVLFFEIF